MPPSLHPIHVTPPLPPPSCISLENFEGLFFHSPNCYLDGSWVSLTQSMMLTMGAGF